jgi:DNA-binding NarL/FixJ family response regulator
VQRTRVLIIDEHEEVRQALEARLRTAPDMDVVGCTGLWREGVRMATEHHPDVVLLEPKRSDGQGMAALRQLRAECPRAAVVVLTSYPDPEERYEALETGAVRYLLKEIGSSYLVQEIRDLTGAQESS